MADDFERRTIIAPWCGAGIEEDPDAPAPAGAALLCSYKISVRYLLQAFVANRQVHLHTLGVPRLFFCIPGRGLAAAISF